MLRWSDRARGEGYGITLHLDSKAHEDVDEFSTSGFIGALVEGDKVTLVVPDSKAVIDSVTSDSVQRIGESFGWKVEKRVVSFPSFLFSLLLLLSSASPCRRHCGVSSRCQEWEERALWCFCMLESHGECDGSVAQPFEWTGRLGRSWPVRLFISAPLSTCMVSAMGLFLPRQRRTTGELG